MNIQKYRLIFLPTVCIVFFILSIASAQPVQKNQVLRETVSNDARVTDLKIGIEKKPLIVKLSAQEKPVEDLEKEAYERGEKRALDRDMTTYTGITAYVTLVLLLVAGLQAVLFLWQLRMMKTTIQDSSRASKAAEFSAKASQESANIAMRSMVAGARPYVHYSGIGFISHELTDTGKIFWRLQLFWKNSGNTPTRGLRTSFNYELLDAPKPDDYLFKVELPLTAQLVGIPPAGAIGAVVADIYGEDLNQVKEGKKFLYIWGSASYRSVFEESGEHITKFCVQATNITGDPTNAWNEKCPLGIQFGTYGNHNCSDQDCLL